MKKFLPAAVILIVSFTLSFPLTRTGLHVIHDDQQIARLFVFDKALREGQFPVRWVDGLGFGFGYPLFVFYPPLVYMIGEAFHFLGFGFIDSIKLVFFLSVFASGLAMYLFSREFLPKLESTIAAIFYMALPYRAVDIFIRGALAESFSFVWLPLILWSFSKLQKEQKIIYFCFSAVFLAFLMITHNLIFLPFMLILPFYLIYLLGHSTKKLSTAYLFILAIFLSLGLSAFFWIPSILEKKYTIVDDLLLVNLANYKIHFVYLSQLWNSAWGFGGSTAGPIDGLSFKIGKLHILVSVLAVILALANLRLKKVSTLNFSKKNVPSQFSILIGTLLLFSAFMTTGFSKFVWDSIPLLWYLQFPWRFLVFSGLFSSILAGYFIYLVKLNVFKLPAAIIILVILSLTNIKLFRPQEYRPNLTDETATAAEVINWDISNSSFEYSPKGVELTKSDLGVNVVNIAKADIPKKKIELEEGEASVKAAKVESDAVEAEIKASSPSKLRANIFNFPGWIVTVDDQIVDIDDKNRLKLITLNVPSGEHRVKIEFKDTLPIKAGNTITVASLFVTVMLIVPRRFYGNTARS